MLLGILLLPTLSQKPGHDPMAAKNVVLFTNEDRKSLPIENQLKRHYYYPRRYSLDDCFLNKKSHYSKEKLSGACGAQFDRISFIRLNEFTKLQQQ